MLPSSSKKNTIKGRGFNQIVHDYILTGEIPDSLTLLDLQEHYSHLDTNDQASVEETIRWTLPMDSMAFLVPVINNIPKAAGLALLTGLIAGASLYLFTSSSYTAPLAAVTTGISFFGQQKYKSNQVDELWEQRKKRAQNVTSPPPIKALSPS